MIELPTTDDPVRIIQGDCLDILRELPDGCVDAVVTDPPYGVNLGSDPTHVIGNRPYLSTTDTPENVRDVVVPAVIECRRLARCVLVTPGTRCMWLYPEPDECGAIYFPAGSGFSRWGFTCSQPILYYGRDPYMPKNKQPNSIRCTENAEKNGHPCPKPIGLMRWLVKRCTKPGDIVLDPFGGSGTTAAACIIEGRRCIIEGRRCIIIEKEPAYVEIIHQRVREAMGTGLLAGIA